jgi:hypothetical protein
MFILTKIITSEELVKQNWVIFRKSSLFSPSPVVAFTNASSITGSRTTIMSQS